MSGSTVGGVVGGAIGWYVSGGTAQGAQIGWMVGSAVGGYVDPDVIKGQRLTDAQVQTSNDGVPRPIIFGTVATAGNVIQSGPLVEHKKKDRTGKGGPVQESYTYSRDYAIRVCEGPVGGILRIWADDKLVYDRRDPAQWPDDADNIAAMAVDTAAFASKITIYRGDEDQLPDPVLEALPAANGGGVGNVPAYRGTCYIVFNDIDLTGRGGSIPQYRFEVASCGEDTPADSYTIGRVFNLGAQSDESLLLSATGEAWDSADIASPGISGVFSAYKGGILFVIGSGSAGARASLDGGLTWRSVIGLDGVIPTSMTYFEDRIRGTRIWAVYDFNGGARYSFTGLSFDPATTMPAFGTYSAALIGGLAVAGQTNRNTAISINGGQGWTAGDPITSFSTFDGAGLMLATSSHFIAFSTNGGDRAARSASGTGWEQCGPLPVGFSGTVRAGVVVGDTIVVVNENGHVARSADLGNTWTLGTPIGFSISPTVDNAMIYANQALLVGAGPHIVRSPDLGDTWTEVFSGGMGGSRSMAYVDRIIGNELPDAPGWVVDANGVLHGPSQGYVTACTMQLDEIVSDLCERVGVSAYDVTPLASIEVRGYLIGTQIAAADAIRTLQQGYFFDFPEWGNYPDTGTKLRAVLRGGAAAFDITDADLVQSDEDQEIRAQAVEFPRKLNLIAPDPNANYEPSKQTFERRTDNVKAVGESTMQLALSLTRDENARKVDIMGKVAWTEAEGRTQFELPEDYSRLTPSDILHKGDKRWRADRVEYGDGTVKVEAVRDRASSYASTVTGVTGVRPTPPKVNVRGPTLFTAMNLPSLRTSDNVPGMYLAAMGLLPSWSGCQVQLSIDGGLSFSPVMEITDAATIGVLTQNVSASGEPITVRTYGDALETITDAQLAARFNAFAIDSATAEIGQFQTATETGEPNEYDLADTLRGQLGTTAEAHTAGVRFVLLDRVKFLPLDISLAGKTLIFRAVTYGTAEANNATYEVVFTPQFASVTVEAYTDDSGEPYTDDSGTPYYEVV